MIKYRSGDILKDNAEALVNTVNCVGVMGRGIALQFKNAFPENFKSYKNACEHGIVQPGRMFVYETGEVVPPRYIINFPTKRHWRGKSRIEDIDAGLKSLVETIRHNRISSVAIPPLGSGLGGLKWEKVRTLIEEAMKPLTDVEVTIYEPKGAPSADEMVHIGEVPNMTPGRAALVELISRYLKGLLDPMVSLLEVHKLMYFMQEAGEPLRLNFQKALYGPYAENLRHVLTSVEGYLVSGYADGGDNPQKRLQLVPGAAEEASKFLQSSEETRARFDKVSELVEGFESPFGLELLSTVHWVIIKEGACSLEDVENKTYAWSERKQLFTKRQIALAVDVLERKGWTNRIEV